MNYGSIMILFALAVGVTISNRDHPAFKITTKRDNDRVVVEAEKDKVVFSIYSPFGISKVVIGRADEKWPEAVVLRLHLTGLEKFIISNEKVKLEASVSSHDGRVRLWKDGKEDSLLDAKSLFWMEIRMIGADGKPAKTIPSKNGYFEMPLPKVLFEDNPKSISVHWIDFYR